MIDDIAGLLARHGLIPRGGFAFGPADDAPAGPTGAPARAVLLVGHGGRSMWPHFSRWREKQPRDLANPLDHWSREAIDAVAAQAGARAAYPSDEPYLPFQQWAMRGEGLRPSPLGILMHPEYGLWHAYRGALLFDDPNVTAALWRARAQMRPPPHACDACAERPCLTSCPVDAHSHAGFAYGACVTHVVSEHGLVCRAQGCRDRNACPQAAIHRYPADQQAFHMAAFARSGESLKSVGA